MVLPADAARILRETAREFHARGWMPGTSGNLSLRLSAPNEPLRFLITASGLDKGTLTEADCVVVPPDPEASPIPGIQASAETPLHQHLYRNDPNIHAVYHVHTVAATTLSLCVTEAEPFVVFEDLEMLKGLGVTTHHTRIGLPVVPNTQDMTALYRSLPPLEAPGFLVRGHGLYAWGDSPQAAKRHVEVWEFLFQVHLALRTHPQLAPESLLVR